MATQTCATRANVATAPPPNIIPYTQQQFECTSLCATWAKAAMATQTCACKSTITEQLPATQAITMPDCPSTGPCVALIKNQDEEFSQDVAQALDKGNKDVVEALDKDNKNVVEALGKVSKEIVSNFSQAGLEENWQSSPKQLSLSLPPPTTVSEEAPSVISVKKPDSMLSAQECADHSAHHAPQEIEVYEDAEDRMGGYTSGVVTGQIIEVNIEGPAQVTVVTDVSESESRKMSKIPSPIVPISPRKSSSSRGSKKSGSIKSESQRSSKSKESKELQSKIPISKRGIPTDVKCDCTPTCECNICSLEIMAKRDQIHPPGCNCLECLCEGRFNFDNKMFSGDNNNQLGVINSTHTPECDCTECLCERCGDPKKWTHPPDCDCLECLCKPCVDPRKNIIKEVSKTETQNKICSSAHPIDCDCLECMCNPCADFNRNKLALIHEHPNGCICQECKCCRCPDRITTMTQPNVKSDRKRSFPPEGCICSECLCIEQGESKTQKAPTSSTFTNKTHPPNCTCLDCICESYINQNKKQLSNNQPMEHGLNCDCVDCLCAECLDPTRGKVKQAEGHGPNCNCPICACVYCLPHPPECGCFNCICEPSTCKIAKDGSDKKHDPICDCLECLCDTTKLLSGIGLPKHGENCTCPICTCSPCPYSLEDIDFSHLPDCDCPECTCAPCPKPPNTTKGDIAYHGPKCDCPVCKCLPCADPKGKEYHPPHCDCETCKCTNCPDPNKLNQISKKTEEVPDSNVTKLTGDTTNELIGKKDEEITDTNVTELTSDKTNDKHHGKECDCPLCKCTECPDPNAKKEPDSKNVKGDSAIGEYHGKECDCPLCKCTGCPDPNAKKEPDSNKVKDDKVKDDKAKDDKVKDDSTIAEYHGNECDCPLCKCTVCPDPNAKREPDSNNVKGDSTIGENHGKDCDCPLCRCTECPDPNAKKEGEILPPSKDIAKMDNNELTNRLIEMENETKQRKLEMCELKELIKQIQCSCQEAEHQAKLNGTDVKKTSSFQETMSGLKLALAGLQEKCDNKECMINAMTKELKLREFPTVSVESNNKYKIPSCPHPDYPNCPCITFAKKEPAVPVPECFCKPPLKPECPCPPPTCTHRNFPNCPCVTPKTPINKSPRNFQTLSSKIPKCNHPDAPNCPCTKPKVPEPDCSCNSEPTPISVDPSPMDIIDVRRLSPDTLLLKWIAPSSELVTGYDIYVDDKLKTRVRSAKRTATILHDLDLKCSILLSIYATTSYGRCQPPATAGFEV